MVLTLRVTIMLGLTKDLGDVSRERDTSWHARTAKSAVERDSVGILDGSNY